VPAMLDEAIEKNAVGAAVPGLQGKNIHG